MPPSTQDRIEGLLLGTAVGDALGLPMEGMKASTIQRLGWTKNLRHRFIFGRGMWSDDTEHSIMLAQALLASEGDEKIFTRKFAWELRWWLFGLPAGVGMATARAMIKLWLGFSPEHSGVFSAGNGSAMRTAVIAAYFPDDAGKRFQLAQAQTQVTHSDPKALIASLAVTEVAACLLKSESQPSPEKILSILKLPNNMDCFTWDIEWNEIISHIENGWSESAPLSKLISSFGRKPENGISGYAYHTVPAVIYTGVQYNWDFKKVITAIIKAGGDTDSTAAIAGALCGAYGGTASIPRDWIASIAEWPTGMNELRVLAQAIHKHQPLRVRSHWSPMLLLRNLIFLVIVLFHGFSRLLPTTLRRSKP